MGDDLHDGAPCADEDLVSRFYRDCYGDVFNSSGLVGWSYRQTHRAVEARHPDSRGLSILEIGAGTGEHLAFVDPRFDRYVMVDLSPAPANPAWAGDDRVSWVQGDVCRPILDDAAYDRVISMCVLHHVDDPGAVLANVRRWLRPGGTFTLFLPSDPGLLNRLNRRLLVTPRARRLGFDHYEVVNAREHHNHYWGLKHELEFRFRDWQVRRRYKPFGIPAAGLSLYSVWEVTRPALVSDGD
jgi:phosphatidylethanolamine/phosphatidyl-N-methylethanolamine N-methyltransferase